MTDEDRHLAPDRLSGLLGVAVERVEVLDETSGSANRVRLGLTYGEPTDLPTVMFLKRNLARFNFPAEMYSTEVRMYRDVLPALGVEQPRVYAVDAAGGDVEFWILMEDLARRPGLRIGSVLEPASVDDVDGVLATLAAIHAPWWGVAERELPWASTPRTNAQMRFWREIGPRLAHKHLRSGHRAALVDPDRWPEASWWPAFDRLTEHLSTGPLTLAHADVHAANVYYLDGRPGGVFDWQMALAASWSVDVTYLLTTALTPADRMAHQADLIRGYLARLSTLGVEPPGFDEAWLRYRQSALYGVLMWLITPDGVHTDAAQTEFLRRCLTAADELDTMAALDS